MRKIVRKFIINGVDIRFQDNDVQMNGGDIVQYIMGPPIDGKENPIQVGDKIPFKGYKIFFNRIIIPNTINLSSSNDIKVLFDNGEEFNGVCGVVINPYYYKSEKISVYEDITFIIDKI